MSGKSTKQAGDIIRNITQRRSSRQQESIPRKTKLNQSQICAMILIHLWVPAEAVRFDPADAALQEAADEVKGTPKMQILFVT